jgi:hypothetical protein
LYSDNLAFRQVAPSSQRTSFVPADVIDDGKILPPRARPASLQNVSSPKDLFAQGPAGPFALG